MNVAFACMRDGIRRRAGMGIPGLLSRPRFSGEGYSRKIRRRRPYHPRTVSVPAKEKADGKLDSSSSPDRASPGLDRNAAIPSPAARRPGPFADEFRFCAEKRIRAGSSALASDRSRPVATNNGFSVGKAR